MTGLPKKGTPQEWLDQPLPLFGEPEPEQLKSRKDEDDAEHIKYRRYKGARSIACHDCTAAGDGVRSATHIRIYRGEERYLCSSHATHWRDLRDKNIIK